MEQLKNIIMAFVCVLINPSLSGNYKDVEDLLDDSDKVDDALLQFQKETNEKAKRYVLYELALMIEKAMGSTTIDRSDYNTAISSVFRQLVTRIDMTAQVLDQIDQRIETLETHVYSEEIEKVKNGEHLDTSENPKFIRKVGEGCYMSYINSLWCIFDRDTHELISQHQYERDALKEMDILDKQNRRDYKADCERLEGFLIVYLQGLNDKDDLARQFTDYRQERGL